VDYVKFTVAVPLTYTIYTTTTFGFDVDTTLTLYGTDGTSKLDDNDNYSTDHSFSMITWYFTATGVYFAKAAHFNPDAGGCGPEFRYTLAITTTSLSSPMPEGVGSLTPGVVQHWGRRPTALAVRAPVIPPTPNTVGLLP
jgi:hypothetical protein